MGGVVCAGIGGRAASARRAAAGGRALAGMVGKQIGVGPHRVEYNVGIRHRIFFVWPEVQKLAGKLRKLLIVSQILEPLITMPKLIKNKKKSPPPPIWGQCN